MANARVTQPLRSTARLARRFARRREGGVMVEFAIFLPFIVMLMLASVEVSSWLWARERVVDAVSAVGDITAQTLAVDEAVIATIFEATDAMLGSDSAFEARTGERTARVTGALSCKCEDNPDLWCFTTLWSHSYDGATVTAGFPVDSDLTFVPQDMGIVEGSTLIISELDYTFYPSLRFLSSDASFQQGETLYYRPRTVERIDHIGGQMQSPAITCPST